MMFSTTNSIYKKNDSYNVVLCKIAKRQENLLL
jgi:hypothetical protein